MASYVDTFRYPGQHVFDGMTMMDIMPAHSMKRSQTFEFLDDDVLLATYPKAATTWLQEMLYLIQTKNFTASKTVLQEARFPMLEWYNEEVDSIAMLKKLPSPRLIKTHLPYRVLKNALAGRKTKIIVGMRNVKDVLVSYYHFHCSSEVYGPFKGNWEDYFELYRQKRIAFGDWFDWIEEWWALKEKGDALFVKFEDIKRDHRGVIVQLANFLGYPLSDDEINKILEYTDFPAMRDNPQVNKTLLPGMNLTSHPFMRKGTIGDWRNFFTKEQNEEVDKLCEKRLTPLGLTFEYDL